MSYALMYWMRVFLWYSDLVLSFKNQALSVNIAIILEHSNDQRRLKQHHCPSIRSRDPVDGRVPGVLGRTSLLVRGTSRRIRPAK